MRTFRELQYEKQIDKLEQENKNLKAIIFLETLFNLSNNKTIKIKKK